MKAFRLLLATTIITLTSIYGQQITPVKSATCTPLTVVGGAGGTSVEKTVTLPSIPFGFGRLFNNNWNTDFAVKSGANYTQYVATLIPLGDGTYTIRMFLKYSDGTADRVFDQQVPLTDATPLIMTGNPRKGSQPFQVNVFVGDVNSTGKSYQLSVAGCK